jgi:hypothetical protein
MNEPNDDDTIDTLLEEVRRYGALSPERRRVVDDLLAEGEPFTAEEVDATLAAFEPVVDGRQQLLARLLPTRVQAWLFRDETAELSASALARLTPWCAVPGADVVRYPILRTLAIDGSSAALATFAELLVGAPPADERLAVAALVPLFQPRGDRLPGAAALFPRLLDALDQRSLAAAVLDLANFVTRREFVDAHPAGARSAELAGLVGSLADRLAKIEATPHEFAATPADLAKMVNESVALIVSLCDALALIGDRSVAPLLHRLPQLAHRRVQTEAAAALVRLGDPVGLEHLKRLAAEPAARSRVLAYLEELGAINEIDEQYRTPEARAAGDLAAWMAQPTRFGLAPDELELIDRKRQYWPGYVDPVECYLFTYEYHRGGRSASGVGLAGPTTVALAFDLQDLPPSDIYALYAGLDSDHPEIFETPLDELSDAQQEAWEQVRDALESQGFADVELIRWANFFGEQHAVATAVREGRPGTVVIADENAEWIALPAVSRRFGPHEAYAMYMGRKLLKTFNREDGSQS